MCEVNGRRHLMSRVAGRMMQYSSVEHDRRGWKVHAAGVVRKAVLR
jgi:hypothetical protein